MTVACGFKSWQVYSGISAAKLWQEFLTLVASCCFFRHSHVTSEANKTLQVILPSPKTLQYNNYVKTANVTNLL